MDFVVPAVCVPHGENHSTPVTEDNKRDEL